MQGKVSKYRRLKDFLRQKQFSENPFFRCIGFLQKRKNVVLEKSLDRIHRLGFKILYPREWNLPLNFYKAKLHYSHQGEDGIVEEIIKRLGIKEGCYVDFGATDGISASNTFGLLLKNWRGVYIEGEPKFFQILKGNIQQTSFKGIKNCDGRTLPVDPKVFRNAQCLEAFLSLEPGKTLDEVLSQTNLPREIDLISIDIDGNDYWIWQSLKNYKPKVVIMEYNSNFHPHESKTIPYDPHHRIDETMYYGASALALYNLGRQKDYTLVANTYSNLFFIRNDYVARHFKSLDIARIKKAGTRRQTQKSFLEVP